VRHELSAFIVPCLILPVVQGETWTKRLHSTLCRYCTSSSSLLSLWNVTSCDQKVTGGCGSRGVWIFPADIKPRHQSSVEWLFSQHHCWCCLSKSWVCTLLMFMGREHGCVKWHPYSRWRFWHLWTRAVNRGICLHYLSSRPVNRGHEQGCLSTLPEFTAGEQGPWTGASVYTTRVHGRWTGASVYTTRVHGRWTGAVNRGREQGRLSTLPEFTAGEQGLWTGAPVYTTRVNGRWTRAMNRGVCLHYRVHGRWTRAMNRGTCLHYPSERPVNTGHKQGRLSTLVVWRSG